MWPEYWTRRAWPAGNVLAGTTAVISTAGPVSAAPAARFSLSAESTPKVYRVIGVQAEGSEEALLACAMVGVVTRR